MKAQRYHSLGLAVLGSLLVLLSGSNVVAMSSSSSPLLDCTEASTGDGDCDLSNNTEECDYDGGDCCECTCVSTTQYVCGVRSGFSCLDPGASCFVDDGSNAATAPPASDGFPEGTLTPTPATVSTEAPTITASTEAPFITTPTEAPSITTPAEETATTFPTAGSSTASSSCIPGSLSDGSCDSENNNEECGYDGGDCCECTCISTTENGCGAGTGFACVDPGASSSCPVDDGGVGTSEEDDDAIVLRPASDDSTEPTAGPTSAPTSPVDNLTATPSEENSTASSSSSCVPGSLSDGRCDADNNNEGCGYDGGDCCECACVSTSEFTCGENDGYDCVDPESSCEELSVEGRSSAYRTAHTSSPVCWQLAMCFFVLSLRRLSQQ